ncbi:hypothetical protein CYMTET_31441 [Cymbomonas tetramitiformis]|uniref:Uncharacterized protein n=1 Tax=Cymbomonas tetramitiformis TaxID=36881 RepID=A0AAE0KQW0_9CHLO|nr:hypothetical protein CYMTET_33446 [Cymbomonas tetramitiformis]KAK3259560.1 hypothetical protein CYMTET_31441 [Cymbomonas tetramitiformis]
MLSPCNGVRSAWFVAVKENSFFKGQASFLALHRCGVASSRDARIHPVDCHQFSQPASELRPPIGSRATAPPG